MGWNDGYERKKFKQRMAKQAEEYRRLGMSGEAIKEMEEYDWKCFREERNHQMHTQSIEEKSMKEALNDEGDNALLFKYKEQLSVTQDVLSDHSRYWWIEEIEDPILAEKFKSLTESDVELLTMYVYEEKTMEEISALFACSKMNISKKLKRIKDYLS